MLPSLALARAGAAVHVAARSRRYGLLRVLGAPPRQLAVVVAADMAVPMLVGALLGSVVYAAFMSIWGSFTLAGTSYWTSDLLLPLTYSAGLPLVVVLVGLVSTARMAYRAGRDPLGVLRRTRGPASYLSYLSAGGVLAGPAAIVAASEMNDNFTLSVWLIMAGLLLAIVGLEGLSRIAVSLTGRLLADRTRAQISGSRMARSADSLLGVSATSVAVLFVVFVAYASFWDDYPAVGAFDVVATLDGRVEDLRLDRTVAEVTAYDGVTRVVPVGRHPTASTSVYTLTCADAPGSVELDAPCVPGSIYLSEPTGESDVVVRADPRFDDDLPIVGVYPVAGRFTPYLLTMAMTAASMGAVALLYAVLLLFRQRQAEFRVLRCQGATRRLLAADLAVLFAAPLIISFGLAVASGLALARTYNAAFDLSMPYGAGQVLPVLSAVLAVGMVATLLVAVWATRISPIVTDPAAAVG